MSNSANKSDSTQLPRVDLIVCGEQEIVQDYPHLNVIREVGAPATVFNKHMGENLCLCLGPHERLAVDSVISTMVNKITSDIRGVYSDHIQIGDYIYQQIFPSWSIALLGGAIIINSPLLLLPAEIIRFKEGFELLYHYDFMMRYGSENLLTHIPQYLFHIDITTIDLRKEIEHVKSS